MRGAEGTVERRMLAEVFVLIKVTQGNADLLVAKPLRKNLPSLVSWNIMWAQVKC